MGGKVKVNKFKYTTLSPAGLHGRSEGMDLSLTSMTGLGLLTSPFIVDLLSGLSSYNTGGVNPTTIESVSVEEGENTSSKALQ